MAAYFEYKHEENEKKKTIAIPENIQRIIQGHFKKAIEADNEYIKFALNEENISIWYVKLRGMSGEHDEYCGGEYIVRIELPLEDGKNGFPYAPPNFFFMTPNGVYGVEKRVCISIGSFHKDEFRSTMKVAEFVVNLVSGFIGWKELGVGINLLNTSHEEKAKLAKQSIEYNKKFNENIDKLIEDSYAEYSKKFKK